jgi:hypothetical protein
MAIFDRGALRTSADGFLFLEKQIKKVTNILAMTQAQYDAIPKKDKNTLYIITT